MNALGALAADAFGALAADTFGARPQDGQRPSADDLINEPDERQLEPEAVAQHRSLWDKLFHETKEESNPQEVTTQPVLSVEEYKRLARYEAEQRRQRRYSEAGLSRYIAVLSRISLVNSDAPGKYALEFQLGAGPRDYCIRRYSLRSANKHIPVTDGRDTDVEATTTAFLTCPTGVPVVYNKIWRADWRGSGDDLRQEALTIYVWRRDWVIMRTLVGSVKLALEDLALGETEHAVNIPAMTGGASYSVSFDLEFCELYTFEVCVDAADVDLTSCGFARSHESYRLALSTDRGKGSFPLADGHWRPNKSSTIHSPFSQIPPITPPRVVTPGRPGPIRARPLAPGNIRFEEPGSLLWRGVIATFANLVINIELQVKHRVGDWSHYAVAQIPAYYLLHTASETFHKRPMECRVAGDTPLISCTLGLPQKPSLQQAHVAMQRGSSAAALKVKVASITGHELNGSTLHYSCTLASRVDEPLGDYVQTFAEITRTIQLSLQGVPPDLFMRKKRPMLSGHKHASLPEDLPEETNFTGEAAGGPAAQSIVKFENWLQQRLLLIYVWQGEESEGFGDETGARKSLGFSALRMTNVVLSIMQHAGRTGRQSGVVSEISVPLLTYGTSWRRTGVELMLSLSLSKLPACTLTQGLVNTALKKAYPPSLPPFVLPNHLGQPQSICDALELDSLPSMGDSLDGYGVGRTVRLVERGSDCFLEPMLCLYEGAGNQRDVALLVTAIQAFNGFNAYLGCSEEDNSSIWFVVEVRDDSTWWYLPGAWHIEVVLLPGHSEELRNPLFPGGHVIVAKPSFCSSVKWIANSEMVRHNFGADITQFREELATTAERTNAAAVRSALRAAHFEVTVHSRFAQLPPSTVATTTEQVSDLERKIECRLANRLLGVFNLEKIPTLTMALGELMDAYCAHNARATEAILRELLNLQVNNNELRIFAFEAPSLDGHYWTVLLEYEIRQIRAAQYALSLKVLPCTVAGRVLVRVLLLLIVAPSADVGTDHGKPLEDRVQRCPALRPTGVTETDLALVREFVQSIRPDE